MIMGTTQLSFVASGSAASGAGVAMVAAPDVSASTAVLVFTRINFRPVLPDVSPPPPSAQRRTFSAALPVLRGPCAGEVVEGVDRVLAAHVLKRGHGLHCRHAADGLQEVCERRMPHSALRTTSTRPTRACVQARTRERHIARPEAAANFVRRKRYAEQKACLHDSHREDLRSAAAPPRACVTP